MSGLESILSSWRSVNALVIGDFMLDQLVKGDAERMSPDAPVPVLAVRSTESQPGGAANVCLDLVALRAQVRAVGVVGADEEGRTLRARLEESGVDGAALLDDGARPTTVKRSLVGLAQHRHPQKMFRLDVESREPITGATLDRALASIEASLDWADVVCIEDYGKGVCAPALLARVIELARKAGKPVLVDPAAIDDYARYAGADIITPNRTEAERAVGRRVESREPDAWAGLARELIDRHDFGAVALTLDRDGALVLAKGGAPRHVPTTARRVYDVTGAGDMVLAALAAAIGNGAALEDAARFANAAAGLEVEIFGVEPIPFERVHLAILMERSGARGKLRTFDELRVEVAAHRQQGRSIVFTNGCFDIIHAGHVHLLRAAAKLGDILIVAINTDDSVRRLKGEGRPVHTESDRAIVLGELESVGAVVLFDEDTPIRLIETVKPDVLVKGADYAGREVVGREIVEAAGGRVELVDLLDGRSTTGAIERIRASSA